MSFKRQAVKKDKNKNKNKKNNKSSSSVNKPNAKSKAKNIFPQNKIKRSIKQLDATFEDQRINNSKTKKTKLTLIDSNQLIDEQANLLSKLSPF